MKKVKKKRKNKKGSPITILIIPFILLGIYGLIHNHNDQPEKPVKKDALIPEKFIPIYKAAEKQYGVPWYLLAAHHRVETKFSSMKTMISPVGAEGPMQFMPCTFVGWKHPSCDGVGKGEISMSDLQNPDIIKKYGGYGVDANGDGRADLWNIEDAVFSAANYLAHNGAANGELQQAIYSYNHSEEYVKEVMYYANIYKSEY